jgi:hypothetical protein
VRVVAHGGVDGNEVFHRRAVQQSVVLAVDIVDERGTTIDAAMGDVQRDSRNVQSWPPGHDRASQWKALRSRAVRVAFQSQEVIAAN